MALQQDLQKIGLSDKEAKVYLAALELGPSAVQKIAQKAKVNRGTTYSILDSLINKGLASTFEQEGKTVYISNPPEALKSIFEIRKKEIEETQNYFESLLPQLKLITNIKSDKPTIKFFEGKQGLLNCFQEFYLAGKEANEPVRIFYNLDLLNSLFTEKELIEFRKVRLKTNIKSKAIYRSHIKRKSTSTDGERIRITDKNFQIQSDVSIYSDRIMIASLGKNFSAILIRNTEIATTLKTMFDLAWIGAKK